MTCPPVRIIAALMLVCICAGMARASHIVGGEVTYKFVSSSAAGNHYVFTLTIYEDCLNGSADAIAKDNPAYYAIYNGHNVLIVGDSVDYDSSVTVPANFSLQCVTNPPSLCLIKKTFTIGATLAPDTSGYIFVYQRCCRNDALANIESPGNAGSTYFCNIPPSNVVAHNNSAIFRNYPPQIICSNFPLTYDNSATDADGDSLSYELCTAYDSPDDRLTNSIPQPPPYDLSNYVHPPYSYSNPLTGDPPLVIDPVTGVITCTPLWLGRYLVAVCCKEWRNGVLINTIHREFQFVVTTCSRTVVANMPWFTNDPSVYIINCKSNTVNFQNTSIGGTEWHWNFGVPGVLADTSVDFEPAFTYPDTGTYEVKLVVNAGTPCSDSIQKAVKIYPTFFTAFVDSGRLCPGDTIYFLDRSHGTVSEVSAWHWDFGDGDTTGIQAAIHSYAHSGVYNVMLISSNLKDCTDTAISQVAVQGFKPLAGNDTIIVKGQSIQFHATGGTTYLWAPFDNLNANNIADPIGYFPDTGTFNYTVKVTSQFGCDGYDTISVQVVGHTAFYVPNAFSPNGDGLNDIFRPVAIGYKSLKFFRVFDRWGEEVYYGNTLEQGWDGTYNRKPAEIGTYYWQIGYTDIYGKDGTMKGDVSLVR